MNVAEQFWCLCAQARQLCETSVDSRQREPAFLDVLNFVQVHPHDRPTFVYCFIHLFHWPELGPFDLIEYCMRELRWQEVQTHLVGIAAVTPETSCRALANRILGAFQPTWPTGRIYARYDTVQRQQTNEAVDCPASETIPSVT
jgi:hypothetical protein